MEKELKPCPFCGAEARLDQRVTQSLWNSNDAVFSHVACDECDISGQDFCDDPEGEEAIDWWNRRAAPVIEMPDKFSPDDCGEWAYWEGPLHAAVEAAGVKMK